mgnify:FL=1
MAVYTSIDDPTEYFQVKLWTGNATTRTIDLDNNATMQPDFSWIKSRSNTFENYWENSTNGTNKYLRSNSSAAEETGTVITYNSTGFGIGSGAENNTNATTNVGWFWKANGGTTASFTESGNNPGGTHQANTTAGFSIVAYTGTGGAGTVSHGLSATPRVIMVKRTSGVADWNVYHASNTSAPETDYLVLNTEAATSDNTRWNDTAPTTSVFSVGTDDAVNGDASTYLAFVFAEKQGYSKFGSYVGNGNADGAFIYTGFKPAWIMVKNITDSGVSWMIQDHKRDIDNPVHHRLKANDSAAEASNINQMDFLSNGFKCRVNDSSWNLSGKTYIYMAFAEHPFTTSTGIPTTAR